MTTLPALRKRVLKLPPGRDTWLVAMRRLRAWVEEDGQVYRTWTLMCLSRSAGTMIGNQALLGPAEAEEVLRHLLEFMLEPAPHSVGRPSRPARIAFEDADLARRLRQPLDRLGIRATRGDAPPEVGFILADLESALREKEEIPGLLAGEGVTPKIAGAFFHAAADFYRAAPWVKLSNRQTLAVSFPAQAETWFASVMGQGGVEYGLVLQRTWEQVEALAHSRSDPLEGIPTEGWHSLSFEPEYSLPFADLDAIEAYGWPVVAEDAYPLPAIFDRDQALRPPGEELLLWERVLRAVVAFCGGPLEPDGAGDYRPREAEVQIQTHRGVELARVRYPAGERDLARQPFREFAYQTAEDAELELPDRRAMEVLLLDLAGGYDDPDLERAQRLMYEAWDQQDPAERTRLAEEALQASPHCADAYVLLAEERARTVGEAYELFAQGVAAGEAALGRRAFREDAGHFWGLLHTRPYMRARYGLANCLWRLKRTQEAEAHYRELLRLNPEDNQGVRYSLLQLLMEIGRDQAALELIDGYDADPSAAISYNRALLEFREQGGSEIARASLEEALDLNPHLPAYLLGRKRVPRDQPALIGLGDEREAIEYAGAYLNHWRATPGALDWLRAAAGAA